MNKISYLLVLFVVWICSCLSSTCFSITQKTVYYTITTHEDADEGNYITVCMEFDGNASGSTKLLMPQINGSDGMNINFKSDIGDIVVADENKSITINDKSVHFITLIHATNAKIQVIYRVAPSYALYFGKDGDIIFSGNILLFLESSSSDEEMYFKIKCKGNAKSHIITSKGMINTADHLFIELGEAMKSWYYIGNKDVSRSHVDAFRNYIFIKIGENPENKLIEIVSKTLSSCENFITEVSGKNDFNNTQKIVITMDGIPDPFYGTQSNNMYVVIYNKNDSLGQFAYSLAHELLHYLFGNILMARFGNDSDPFFYWFDEGFTYYYSSLLLYESGILTLHEYLEIINAQIKEYYQTYAPLRSFINETYACTGQKLQLNGMLSDYFMHSLHGSLFAHNLDNLLKIKSNNKSSLKELLKVLLSSCKSFKCYISKMQFLRSIENVAIDKKKTRWFENFVNMHLIDYRPIFLVPRILEGKARLDYHCCDEIFDVGFNVTQTMCSGVIFGIKKNSNPYRLGVRDGDNLSSLDITPKRVALVIDKNYDLINYKPTLNSTIPRYRKERIRDAK